MSTTTPSAVAVPAVFQLGTPVTVIHGDREIGHGTAEVTERAIRIQGSYNWPPDSIAEVRFSFDFAIQTETACRVAVDWPGLIAPIGPTEASYFMALLLARPDFLITTPAGDHITAALVGPPHQPEITTGISVGVTPAGAQASWALLFRYERPRG